MAGKITIGQAIDSIITALTDLDDNNKRIVIQTVSNHFNLGDQISETGMKDKGGSSKGDKKVITIRSLKEEKLPNSAIEMACIVAYYLQEVASNEEKTQEITKEHLDTYFKQAGYKLPKAIKQLLVDANAAGYFNSAGAGKYKLNGVGYNLVVHDLPKQNK